MMIDTNPNSPSFILAEQSFSTKSVTKADRETYWRDEVLGNIGAVELHRLNDAPIDASMNMKLLNSGLVIGSTNYGEQRLKRNKKHIDSSDGGFFILGTQLAGGIDFKQQKHLLNSGGKHDARLTHSGASIIFYYAEKPFDIALHHCQDLIVRIPEDMLLTLCPQAKDMPAQLLTQDRAYFGLVSQFMHTLYNLGNDTSYAQGEQLKEALLQTMIVANAEVLKNCCTNNLDAHHYESALLFMKRNYHMVELDASAIAVATGVSVGHLQKVFAKYGTSIMQTLWDIRLKAASQCLMTSCKTMPIYQIAYACGFKNQAHFSKTFRVRFGASPKAWALACQSGQKPSSP